MGKKENGWTVTVTLDLQAIQYLAKNLVTALAKYGISINLTAAVGIISGLVKKLASRGNKTK